MIFPIVLVHPSSSNSYEVLGNLEDELKRSRVPSQWAFMDLIAQTVETLFEYNSGINGVIVISERGGGRELAVMSAVARMPNVHVWAFDGLKDAAIDDDCFKYFPDVYPHFMKKKDGIQRILAAVGEKYLGEEFFDKLNALIDA